ncbi:Protein sgm1 [Colletotrichum chlorophyti]|uniref:Protein sgm1 n=1 Tax=Colletotrichum chlorophyti TaxID=708187 RepID=A0A1Q8RZB6_9PEZI|nr:Protein sgm1 [Colletotrichum chlorophyti]
MAAPAKSSRWGSFLQQAVAGVEARLDNILAEGDPNQPQTAQAASTPAPVLTKDVQAAPPRSSTSSRTNDRLQERLAKAMASKANNSSEARSVASDSHSARPSTDSGRPEASTPPQNEHVPASTPTTNSTSPVIVKPVTPETPTQDAQKVVKSPPESNESQTPQDARQNEQQMVPQESNRGDRPEETFQVPVSGLNIVESKTEDGRGCKQCSALRTQVEALESRLEQTAKEQQEEIHRYVEQFEALQAKLQFLARDATDAARKSAVAAPAGTFERNLAERDEKISLLMEEGRNLAATEQKHRTIIKKLKSQLADNEKMMAGVRTHNDKLTTELDMLRPRAIRVEELEQSNQELRIKSNGMQDELNALRVEIASNKSTIDKLRDDLRKASDQANSAVARANEEALVKEKCRAKDLEDTIAALQVEKNLIAERAKASAVEAQERATQAAERARIMELEMKGELQAMEGKLEAMRALAEEASSGAVGDTQAKLLRQVETLQTQHAIAAENWQRIEASLVTRVSNLERERDDALRRESEMRKKARETANRCKRQEEELQELTIKVPNHQRDIEAYQARIEGLQKRAEDAEAALLQVKADLERQQTAWKMDKTDSDRRPWLEDHLTGVPSRIQSRPDSPLLSIPTRTLSSDLLLLQSVSGRGRKISTPASGADGFHEGSSAGRRLSGQPPRPPLSTGGSGLPLAASSASFELPPDSLPTPTSHVGEKEDMFEGVEIASSPRQMVQDMVSVSTVGAGPSVQLVERMSAAIRRLEAEKVTSREELARICGQRDEARAEIVALMKELELGKMASNRVAELEAEVSELNSRYQTTLELLGEKSELVEELRADVQDVKAMYRDLVERTVR